MRITRGQGVDEDQIKKSNDMQNGNRTLQDPMNDQDEYKKLELLEVKYAEATAYDSKEE